MKSLVIGQKPGRIPALIIALVAAAVILILVLILLGAKQSKPAPTPQQPSSKTQEEKEIFSYVGRISTLTSDRIMFKANAIKNQLSQDTTITALVTDKTQYSRVTVPKTLPQNREPGQPLFTREEITFSDLKVGDEITAISATNIRGRTEFTASKIEVVSVK